MQLRMEVDKGKGIRGRDFGGGETLRNIVSVVI
jgi:hypothetical protein